MSAGVRDLILMAGALRGAGAVRRLPADTGGSIPGTSRGLVNANSLPADPLVECAGWRKLPQPIWQGRKPTVTPAEAAQRKSRSVFRLRGFCIVRNRRFPIRFLWLPASRRSRRRPLATIPAAPVLTRRQAGASRRGQGKFCPSGGMRRLVSAKLPSHPWRSLPIEGFSIPAIRTRYRNLLQNLFRVNLPNRYRNRPAMVFCRNLQNLLRVLRVNWRAAIPTDRRELSGWPMCGTGSEQAGILPRFLAPLNPSKPGQVSR